MQLAATLLKAQACNSNTRDEMAIGVFCLADAAHGHSSLRVFSCVSTPRCAHRHAHAQSTVTPLDGLRPRPPVGATSKIPAGTKLGPKELGASRIANCVIATSLHVTVLWPSRNQHQATRPVPRYVSTPSDCTGRPALGYHVPAPEALAARCTGTPGIGRSRRESTRCSCALRRASCSFLRCCARRAVRSPRRPAWPSSSSALSSAESEGKSMSTCPRDVHGDAASMRWQHPCGGNIRVVATSMRWQRPCGGNIRVVATSMRWQRPCGGNVHVVATSMRWQRPCGGNVHARARTVGL